MWNSALLQPQRRQYFSDSFARPGLIIMEKAKGTFKDVQISVGGQTCQDPRIQLQVISHVLGKSDRPRVETLILSSVFCLGYATIIRFFVSSIKEKGVGEIRK